MRLPNTKIEGVCSKDETRPVLAHVYFDKDKQRLVACDGWIIAMVAVLRSLWRSGPWGGW